MIHETLHPTTAPLFDRRLKEERDYWLKRLSPPPEPVGPELARRVMGRMAAGAVDLELPERDLSALDRLTGGSPFLTCTALVAALEICLYRISGRRRFAVGTPGLRGGDGALPAANALAILAEVAPERTFRELLLEVRGALLAAYERQSYPFALLLADLGLETAADGSCRLFDVALAFAEIHSGLPAVGHSLTLCFGRPGGRLAGRLEARPGRFARGDLERFAACFRQALAAALGSPATPIGNLAPLAATARHQVIHEWNDTAQPFAELHVLHRLIEAQVDRTPDAVAVSTEEGSLTYRELDRRANRLAHRLRCVGVMPDVPVGVYVERSRELVVGLLAVLKAGGAYVPIDPGYPRQRVELMLADSGAPVVLTLARLASEVAAQGVAAILLDDAAAVAESGERLTGGASADHLAYVIYTSGSTGRPKGAMNTHRAICNRLLWMQEDLRLTPHDRVLQKTPLSFDVSVWELFLPLLTGACLVLVRPGGHRDSAFLAAVIRGEGITVLHFVPSMLRCFLTEENLASCNSLRAVVCSGEALPLDLAAAFLAASSAALYNLYGPTEAAVDVSRWRCASSDALRGTVPIGRPIANLRLHVLDGDLGPVPAGGSGDLYLGGAGLARGYHRRPDLTADRFIPDPVGGGAGARLYRTGDHARLALDGAVEFLGRADDQVKIRGVRIELGEIEAALLAHPGVHAAAVMVREERPGHPRLVAYTVLRAGGEPAVDELRAFLVARLPEAMIPSAWARLGSLPLSPSGKLDRRALPPLAGEGEVGTGGPLGGPTEEVVAYVWRSVLGVPWVGSGDDFFALGGHSLLATQVASRLRTVFRVEVVVARLFERRTVAALSAEVAALRGGRELSDEIARLYLSLAGAAAARAELLDSDLLARFEALLQDRGLDVPCVREIPRHVGGGLAPLSFTQERVWFQEQVERGGVAYNLMTAVRLRGPLDPAAVSHSADEIVRRHEALRTFVSVEQGVPVQVVAPPRRGWMRWVDLGGLAERDAEVRRLAAAEVHRPFDLTSGPLVRLTAVRLGAEEHVLVLTAHHIVSDGWSLGVFVRELAALYPAFLAGRPSPLPELPLQYGDFARWQREWLTGEILAAQLGYWRDRLAGSPRLLRLPVDHPRAPVQSSRGATRAWRLPAAATGSLRAFCRSEGLTLFMGLLSAFKALLRAVSGQDDIVVGTDVANRGRRELEGLVGFFVNSLVLRTDLGGDPTFRELAGRVRETTLGAYAHQDLPFSRLVEELRPERDPSHNPFFQAVLSLHNFPRRPQESAGLVLTPFSVHGGAAKFDLTLFVSEGGDELQGLLEYNTDLFDEPTIDRLLEQYRTVLDAMAAGPDRRLSSLSLASGEHIRGAIDDFNEDLEVF